MMESTPALGAVHLKMYKNCNTITPAIQGD